MVLCIMLTSSLVYCFLGYGIRQVFPSNTSYICPGPSLHLECRFPGKVTTVLWTFSGISHIPDGYPGHVIDNSMTNSGVSSLYVDKVSHWKKRYRCIVVFRNCSQEYPQRTRPQPASNFPRNSHKHKHDFVKPSCSQFVCLSPMCIYTQSNSSSNRTVAQFDILYLHKYNFLSYIFSRDENAVHS